MPAAPSEDQPLRVAFDVTAAVNGRTGMARYVTELAAALELDGVRLNRYAVGRGLEPTPARTRHLRIPARLIAPAWDLARWPAVERLAGPSDLLHVTGLRVPPTRLPLVVTVHDVAGVHHPELHPPRQVRLMRSMLARLRRAAVVITVSQVTADDLAAMGIRPEHVVVAPLGFRPLPPAPASAGRPYGRFVLTVGESSPRKRYEIVVDAMRELDPELKLVMAGPRAGGEESLQARIAAGGLADRVLRIGPVSDAELADLYGAAAALCFPSIAEGFGLPVLEAMASGLPVIVRDLPIMREVAGEAAVYVAGEEPSEWARAIERLLADPARREALGAAGRRRAAEFTWERTAAATRRAYALALGATR